MKIYSALLFLAVIIGCMSDKPSATIYLVRHSEKADTSRDPDLSEIGILRSERLANLLKDEKIEAIYSTNFKRTIQTAAPLIQLTGLSLNFYATDTLPALAKRLQGLNQNALVIGHSNTTVSLLDAFGLRFRGKKIEDHDYSNLFRITVYPNSKKIKLKELKF